MNKNPYSVLGVNENATDEEITKAYKELVKKYHPDKYANSDLADLANEKMTEINVAYETIQKMRKEGWGSGTENGGSYGKTGSANAKFASIRALINAKHFSEAMARLDEIEAYDRGAEWNFLYGLSLYGMGRVFDAISYIDRACSMDPSNLEYRGVKDRLSGTAFSYSNGRNYNSGNTGCGCSNCDMCSTLICADCCCECCGGDLISCC